MWRTLRTVVFVAAHGATLVTVFFMSCAYIMVNVFVVEHFCLLLFMIMLTLYRAGMHLREGTRFGCKEVLLLFVVTAGITLSNGIVVLLAAMSVNGRAAFRPRFFFTTLVLPGVLMLALGVGLAEHAKNEAATLSLLHI